MLSSKNPEELIDQVNRDKENPDNGKPIRSEDVLALQEEILDLFNGFYFMMDEDFFLQYISNSISRELGWETEDLTHKKFSVLLSRESADKWANAMQNPALKKDLNKLQLEVEVRNSDDRFFIYELHLMKDPERGLWRGLCYNIHERRMHEEKLIGERNNAELNDKRKSDFLANMSHEIRTPLNGIVGFSSMLSRDNLTPEKRDRYLGIIRSSTAHLLTLVNDIIDHSKIEANQLKINYHVVQVHRILDDILASFVAEGKRLERNQLRIIKQVPSNQKKLEIVSDETRIRQVLNNLMGNAIKFTEKGEITFGYTLPAEKRIRFFVRDSGVGLSEEAQDTIFRRFKQTGEGKKEKHDGYGLGLSISKGIVELMGGEIGVISEAGKGAEFYFILPMNECDPNAWSNTT